MNMAVSGDLILNNSVLLDKFLEGVQSRAFRIAQIATSNSEDALDLVQDTMFKLVEKYSDRSEQEWIPLFYRILNSRINDWYRRNAVRNRHRNWMSNTDEEGEDPIQTAPDPYGRSPDEETVTNESMDKLQIALSRGTARAPTAGLPATRMGRTGLETDRNSNGMRRGKRQDPLFSSHSQS